MNPLFSVVVATRNRAARLPSHLTSLIRQSLPEGGEFEIIVVDNASRDNTRAVVEGIGRTHPGLLRYIREEKQGTYHARNRGVDAARGAYIAFLDDDCIASPRWLSELYDVHRRFEAHGVGGKCTVVLPFSAPPRWWPVDLENSPYFRFDLGDQPLPFSSSRIGSMNYPAPTNMSIQRVVFDRVGRFHAPLERQLRGRAAGEIDFFERVRKAGFRLYYAPQAEVEHRVPAERFHPRQLFERVYFEAASFAISDRHNRPFWTFTAPRLVKKRIQSAAWDRLLAAVHRRFRNDRLLLWHWLQYLRSVGYLHGFRGKVRDEPPLPHNWTKLAWEPVSQEAGVEGSSELAAPLSKEP